MPMMLTPDTLPFSPSKKRPFTHSPYGHQTRTATQCQHEIHPSNSHHTPLCPKCTIYLARGKSDVALKELVAKGGLRPPKHMRNRRWNKARKVYLIAKQRLEKTRKEDQLRWERERAWEEAHQLNTNNVQAAVLSLNPSLCPVCDSLVASYPTTMPEAQVTKYVAWWEKLDALATSHTLVHRHRTALHSRNQNHIHTQTERGNSRLCQIIQAVRRSVQEHNELRLAWEIRQKTEAAIRRKHGLGDCYIGPDFWNEPISGYYSRRAHQNNKDQTRMAERRARGGTARPRLPRSSLSYSETTEDVYVEPHFGETLKQKEEREEWERLVKKTAGEIGYLYFIGGGVDIDHLAIWCEDFDQSNQYLVERNKAPNSETTGDEDVQEDWDDDMDVSEMDVDEA
ncbi:uncharacterized protein ALTATR162_LOCUS6098 [Alternaria atra]|uniref:Uncharacterized protein n=1 Tax=Alternaria atra TaxID=119953 RepID=A0A8J2I2D0_9PLEO|nr:uncharacterized protein ALTATR162_LOCUS6098 [Alternaria atra]CAG5161802.1 unnamed protein product [Alternaria atra]